ncbi:GTP pyrophosphokinase family protein [Corynebacterium sp. HMSC04H06]|uniref:GTP pyrophosphokinase n=1 Tax=Corynebacterium sp. HMSC04H06 TaxID=1581050 RepID=UPI000AC50426|nr:GTP pyrophosphokinase family protein [Corynebacterium sp. HMSC04H06]
MARLGTRYHDWNRQHPHAAADFHSAIEELLNDAGVIFDHVSARVKSWSSFKAKAKKRNSDGDPVYPHPWEDIHDLVGVRVTVFHSTAIPQAIDVLSESFEVLRSVDKAAQTRISGGFGYGSHHLVLQVTDAIEELGAYRGFTFEVQVRTVLQHAWAEFEHDIRYKQGPNPPSPQVDRLFTLAAGLIELADQQFDEIAALKSPRTETTEDVVVTAETLPGILTMLLGSRFPRSRSDHYRWLAELLELNGVTTVRQLQELLNDEDIASLQEAFQYRFRPGHIRLVDDLLLNRFGQAHIDATAHTGNRTDRAKRLRGRLKQLRG